MTWKINPNCLEVTHPTDWPHHTSLQIKSFLEVKTRNFNFFFSGAPSVYLTASALRVLYEVHTHFDSPVIDPLILVRSLDWLIRQQSEDGSFKEVFVYNGEYQRKLPIEFQEIALTAHVLISLSPFIEKVRFTRNFSVSISIANPIKMYY